MSGSRLDIDQLRLDQFPQAWLNRPLRHQVHTLSQNGLQPLGQRDESQPDAWIDFDQHIDIAVGRRFLASLRTEQGQPPQRKLSFEPRLG